jgi:hypothetical protein
VWGYGAVAAASRKGLLLHHAPSLTIEAKWNRPVRVKWINELVDGEGKFLPHLLPVDPTLHWANPPGGPADRDSEPTFETTPGAYDGPVPIVTHVHPATRPRARGTSSSPARRTPGTAPRGAPGTPSSSTPTPIGHRPSGTTTTPSG